MDSGFDLCAWSERWQQFLIFCGASPAAASKSHAFSPQVLNMEIDKGRINARIQIAHRQSCLTVIRFKTFTRETWDILADAISARAALSAALIAGDVPIDIESIAKQSGVALFPETAVDIAAKCTCQEAASPCSHSLTALRLLGGKLSVSPTLIFLLRGKSVDDLLCDLNNKRAARQKSHGGQPSAPAVSRFPQDTAEIIRGYWQTAVNSPEEPDPELLSPSETLPWLRQLGVPPEWPEHSGFAAALTPLYQHAAKKWEK